MEKYNSFKNPLGSEKKEWEGENQNEILDHGFFSKDFDKYTLTSTSCQSLLYSLLTVLSNPRY